MGLKGSFVHKTRLLRKNLRLLHLEYKARRAGLFERYKTTDVSIAQGLFERQGKRGSREEINTTGLAGGMHWPCKGPIPAALTGPENLPPAPLSLAAPKGALLIAFSYHSFTRKRVIHLFGCHLIIDLVFQQLRPNVLDYAFLIPAYRIHVIPSTPKPTISVSILQV